MNADILLGLQWGDEGKGKIVDLLTPDYEVVARFQGGPNAGHTLEFGELKHVLHTIPSGIFRPGTLNIVGNGVVIDPVTLQEEVRELEKHDISHNGNLYISRRAHLILPTHRLLDAASEEAKGKERIGSTLKGIGPAYMDKTGRNGLRVGDIFSEDFEKGYRNLVEKHMELLRLFGKTRIPEQEEADWFRGIEALRNMHTIDSEYLLNKTMDEGKRILAEGAQGALLDLDFGSYPYVTSSNTTSAGVCSGLGVAPGRVGNVMGVFKAYCTRVGGGPFPTELTGEEGEALQQKGDEFGATTGRARRCGWLDLPALKYAIMLNGVTELAMTKADVFSGLERIRVCTHYRIDGKTTDELPFDLSDKSIEPVYKDFEGWAEDLSEIREHEALPKPFKIYLDFLEKELGVPITIISLGPKRKQSITRPNPKKEKEVQ